jgi:hypothetical protein
MAAPPPPGGFALPQHPLLTPDEVYCFDVRCVGCNRARAADPTKRLGPRPARAR